ncbi:hypothetical protein [Bradyrhizobium elkanii]|nr:hypothetical protein [Bradyrhizobium elkanii]WLC12238.1 hypothetical protein QIH86_20400 [Bradyrhizobium elkanii USDA 94]
MFNENRSFDHYFATYPVRPTRPALSRSRRSRIRRRSTTSPAPIC